MRQGSTRRKQKKLRIEPAAVRLILRVRGMSRQIAELAGVSACYVSLILHGHRAPTDRFIQAMTQAILQEAHNTRLLDALNTLDRK